MERKCENCEFWVQQYAYRNTNSLVESDYGECRFSPLCLENDGWKRTEKDDWCGEFKPKQIEPDIDMDTNIDDLDITMRLHNCLRLAGLYTLRGIVSKSEYDLLQYQYFDMKSIAELKEILASKGLKLKGCA